MFEGLFQPLHLVVVLTVVLIIFGPGKLPELGHALGKTLREFREAMAKIGENPDGSSATPRAIERQDVARCSSCGAANSPNNKFCGSCGRAIESSVTAAHNVSSGEDGGSDATRSAT